jgi:hypothetical protein
MTYLVQKYQVQVFNLNLTGNLTKNKLISCVRHYAMISFCRMAYLWLGVDVRLLQSTCTTLYYDHTEVLLCCAKLKYQHNIYFLFVFLLKLKPSSLIMRKSTYAVIQLPQIRDTMMSQFNNKSTDVV